MKIYEVGGCVRDRLLGLEPKDTDFLIVGATPSDISELINKGYKQVGADFPVFLHPKTGDEYALARIERKTGVGYLGFECETENVSLEEDLGRRDLTINSLARDTDTGEIFDFFGGQQDLKDKIVRHTSVAFKEDPVRAIRAVRFAARYGFTIAPETKEFIKEMIQSGELNHLTKERVYAEIQKALEVRGNTTDRFFKLLAELNIFQTVFKKDSYFFKDMVGKYSKFDDANTLTNDNKLALYFFHFTENELRDLSFGSHIIKDIQFLKKLNRETYGSYRDLENLAMVYKSLGIQRNIKRLDEFYTMLWSFSLDNIIRTHGEDSSCIDEIKNRFDNWQNAFVKADKILKSIDFESVVRSAKEQKLDIPTEVHNSFVAALKSQF